MGIQGYRRWFLMPHMIQRWDDTKYVPAENYELGKQGKREEDEASLAQGPFTFSKFRLLFREAGQGE